MGDVMTVLAATLAISFLQFFEAKNKTANFVVTPPTDGASVEPVLPDMVVKENCRHCGGSGVLVREEPDFGQFKGRIGKASKVHKQPCPLCDGKGKVKAYMNHDDLMLQVSSDYAAFAARHKSAGDIPVGEAFVPRAIYDEIDKAQRKLVDEAFGHPCKKCNWTGLEACKKCKGTGTIGCTQKSDCKGGWQVVYDDGDSRRANRKNANVRVSACTVCGGANALVCPECGGRRALPCSKCNGHGVKKKGSL